LSEARTPVELWGVLNVTPDSFSDGGRFLAADAALAHAERMRAEGADVLDVGGESSRPPGRTYGSGAPEVSAAEESARVLPVIEALAARGFRVSIDTVKAEVADAAVRAGAAVINDVSCGRDSALLRVAAERGAELVLMHNRGRGERSGANVAYVDVVAEVREELLQAVERAVQVGVRREAIWLDPGVGFAKTAAQSAALIAATSRFVATGHRVLVGPSRKSFLAELTVPASGVLPGPAERLGGTAAAVTVAVLGGARAVRVHDVRDMHQAVRLTEHMLAAVARDGGGGSSPAPHAAGGGSE
jgi:dihydropteroate synthase